MTSTSIASFGLALRRLLPSKHLRLQQHLSLGTNVKILGYNGLQAVGSLAIVPLMAAVLEPKAYGAVALAMGTLQIIRGVTSLGLSSAITIVYFNSEDGAAQSQSLLTISVAGTCLSALVAATALMALDRLVLPVGPEIWAGLGLGTVAAVALNLQAWARSAGHSAIYAGALLGMGLAGQLAGLIAVVLLKPSYLVFLVAWLVASSVIVLFSLAAARPATASSAGRALGARALRLGAPTIVHTLSAVLLSVGDRFMIKWLLGPASLGLYQPAYALSSAGIALGSSLSVVWAPLVLKRGGDSARSLSLFSSTAPLLIITGWMTTIVILFIPKLLGANAQTQYSDQVLYRVAPLIGLATVPYVVYLAAQISLLGSSNTRRIASSSLSASCLNLILNYLLINIWGLAGAGLSTLLSYVVLAALSVRSARKVGSRFRIPHSTVGAVIALQAVYAALGLLAGTLGSGLGLTCTLALSATIMSAILLWSTRRDLISCFGADFLTSFVTRK